MNNDGNIFHGLPNKVLTDELFEVLLEGNGYKLERIISTGQTTADNKWYDQSHDEWVLLLKGNAKLLFKDSEQINLTSGDYILIPAHKCHKVIWTDPKQVCIWLAFHCNQSEISQKLELET